MNQINFESLAVSGLPLKRSLIHTFPGTAKGFFLPILWPQKESLKTPFQKKTSTVSRHKTIGNFFTSTATNRKVGLRKFEFCQLNMLDVLSTLQPGNSTMTGLLPSQNPPRSFQEQYSGGPREKKTITQSSKSIETLNGNKQTNSPTTPRHSTTQPAVEVTELEHTRSPDAPQSHQQHSDHPEARCSQDGVLPGPQSRHRTGWRQQKPRYSHDRRGSTARLMI